MNKKKVAVLAGVLASVFVAGGCMDKAFEPFNDAPIKHKDDSPAVVYSMPDGFNNVASKCDGYGHRIFVIYHENKSYGSVAVINDPSCGG